MKKLGTVKNIKLDEYINYVSSLTPDQRVERYWNPSTSIWGPDNAGYNMFKNAASSEIEDSIKKAVYDAPFSSRNASGLEYNANKIRLFINNNVPIPYVFRNEFVTVLNLTTELATVLNEFVEVSPLTDVDALPISKIKQLVNTVNNTDINNVPDTLDNSSIKSLKDELVAKQEELEKCKKETQDQIDAYRQKLDEQMRIFREEIMKKQNELFAQKQTLLDQVFVLEDKIMDLRCILKESFDIVNISTGPRCEKERPVIVYQKFRYIEDEIIRLTTLQAIQFTGKHKLVEQMIKANPVLLETLCPTEKCVTVCKMTKDNKYYVRNDYGFFDTLETLHGNQLFVLIRDGKQVDGLWIDEDIFLQDNLFLTESTQETDVVTENTQIRSKVVKQALSRKYLFIILQVCINEGLININKDSHILQKSNNIIFSDADRLIDVNLYPNLNEYVNEINKIENCKVGDTILVVQRANGSSYVYNGYRRDYHEYRGNGNNDRAHDAHVSTGLNKINAIIEQRTWGKAELCVFVSAEKEWSSSGARANVRIDEDEYINLTWVSSNHIQYWIDSKKIGGFSCNSYAQLCTLLKESLQHVVNREKEEFELINTYTRYAYIPKHIDKLTEWKFRNKVRRLHSKNVRKFIYEISK